MATESEDEMLTAEEAAALAKVTPVTMRRAARKGQVPGATKKGRDWLFRRSGVLAWGASPEYHKTGPKKKK